MNRNTYYHRGNGRNLPVQRLVDSRKEVYSQINQKKNKVRLKDIENKLNYYSDYDEFSKLNQEDRLAMQDALRNRYNAINEAGNFSKNLSPSQDFIDIGNIKTYLDRNASEFMQKYQKDIEKGRVSYSQTGLIMWKTLKKLLTKFNNLDKKMLEDAKNQDLGSMQNQIMSIEELSNEVLSYEPLLKENYPDNKFFTTRTSAQKDIEFVRSLTYWISFLERNPITKGEIGVMAEALASLVSDIEKVGEAAAFEQGKNEILKSFTDSGKHGGARTGQKSIISSGINLNTAYSIGGNITFDTHKTNVSTGFSHNGIDYKMNINYDTNSDRQVKCDISFQDNLKASVKNWNDFSFMNKYTGQRQWNDLGSTYILNAISRTYGKTMLDNYIYVIQDNKIKHSPEGERALKAAHEFAELGIMADIAMGFSQKKAGTDANILIINNRKERKWHVIDLNELIIKSLGKITTEDGFLVEVEGYDATQIEFDAWGAMSAFMSNNKYEKQTHISNWYEGMVYQQLHSKKVRLAFKTF